MNNGEMKKADPHTAVAGSITRVEKAEARAEQAEARTEQAKARADLAESRTEQAESRTELAKTRTDQAESRTEQAQKRTEQAQTRTEQAITRTEQAETRAGEAEATVQHLLQRQDDARQPLSRPLLQKPASDGPADREAPLHQFDQLTGRQREILQLIAEGQNTKQIAEILKVSPKTVEYHRMKLMAGLNLHDIPGLVRYALRVGLLPKEG